MTVFYLLVSMSQKAKIVQLTSKYWDAHSNFVWFVFLRALTNWKFNSFSHFRADSLSETDFFNGNIAALMETNHQTKTFVKKSFDKVVALSVK